MFKFRWSITEGIFSSFPVLTSAHPLKSTISYYHIHQYPIWYKLYFNKRGLTFILTRDNSTFGFNTLWIPLYQWSLDLKLLFLALAHFCTKNYYYLLAWKMKFIFEKVKYLENKVSIYYEMLCCRHPKFDHQFWGTS